MSDWEILMAFCRLFIINDWKFEFQKKIKMTTGPLLERSFIRIDCQTNCQINWRFFQKYSFGKYFFVQLDALINTIIIYKTQNIHRLISSTRWFLTLRTDSKLLCPLRSDTKFRFVLSTKNTISIDNLFLFFSRNNHVLSTHAELTLQILCTHHTLWHPANNVIRLTHSQSTHGNHNSTT